MPHENLKVPIDASRVCDAIARIGYSPAAGLMDIIDNSVTAGATVVELQIETHPDKTYADKNNVLRYRIIDNGNGMTEKDIINALKLGAKADYPPNCLSKFGMGLKSAGFSLGSRIQVVSKSSGSLSRIHFVDKNEIAAAQEYVICRAVPTKDEATEFATLLPSKSGTVVDILGSGTTSLYSAKRIMDVLQEQLGVVYYHFLAPKGGLTIKIKCTGKPEVVVAPLDILFADDSENGFNKDTYDGKRPCKVFSDNVPLTADKTEQAMNLEVVIFPRDKMSTCIDLTEDERKKIETFSTKRRNKGFFIYRNNRLIRWGDDLDGLVGKDDIGFRARMTINSTHDDLLHVDVSKQRLSISEDILNKIETLIRLPLRQAGEAFEICTQKIKKSGDEGADFNDRNQDLVEEDLDAPAEEPKVKVTKERKRKKIEDTKKNLEDEPPKKDIPVAKIPVFERVRYSEKVASLNVWEAGVHPSDGTFVRINKNHPFYQTVLSRLEEADPLRQTLEGLLWCLAVAENKSIENIVDVDAEVIEKVLSRFKKVFGTNLDTWCGRNQDLIGQ